VNVALFRLS